MLRFLRPLRRLLPAFFAAMLTVVVAAVCAVAYAQTRAAFLAAAHERAVAAAARISVALDESLDAPARDAERAAADPVARAVPVEGARARTVAGFAALFARERARTRQLVGITLFDREGRPLLAADSAHGVTTSPVLGGELAERVTRVPPPVVGPLVLLRSGAAVFDVAAPVTSERGDTLGFLIATRRIDPAASRGATELIGQDARVLVGNADGSVWWGVGSEDRSATLAAAWDGSPLERDGATAVGASNSLRGAPWRVVVEIPRSVALAPARRFGSVLATASMILLALAAILSWRVTLLLTRPLIELSAAARGVARGDYARRVGRGLTTEVNDMMSAFNQMAGRIESDTRERADRTSMLEATLRELRESEARYRQLVETSPDAIVLSRAGRVLYLNPAGLALWGARSLEEVVGRSVLDLTVPEDRPAVMSRLATTEYEGRSAPLAQRTLLRFDGSLLKAEVASSPFVVDGSPSVLSIIRDVTERKRAEDALRDSEARYRHVATHVPGMVYQFTYDNRTADCSWGFTVVSDGARELLGVEPAELLADPSAFFELVHPDDRSEFDASASRAVATLSPWHWEGRYRLASGEEKWIQATARQTRRPDGTTVVDGLLLDATERHQVMERLRQSELRFQLAGRATRDIIYDWDIAADRLIWGETMTAAFGYDPAEIAPHAEWWIRWLHPDDMERVLASLDDLMSGDAEAWSCEYRFRCRDGSFKEVLDRAYLVRGDDGQPLRLVGSLTDLTERKALEAQLRQSQKMEAVGQLAGGVAHDFNNILTAITSYSALLLEETSASDARHDWMLEIAKGAKRAAALTRQLLAFSRRQVLQPRTVDLNRTVRDLEVMLRRLIAEDITLVAALEPALWAVHADPGQLEQVIVNLAVNARDAMPEGGALTIETSNVLFDGSVPESGAQRPIPAGEYVCIAVTDTGCGMDAATQARIFEPFFTTKEPGKGTGLGLSTVYGIVEQSGGHVRCSSAPGAGTSFRVYLPRTAGAAADAPAPLAPRPARVGGGSETVLLVEDDTAVRDVSHRILTQRGYTVLEATNGAEALDLCARHDGEIHLIVSDMVMPEMHGPELGRLVRERHPDIALLFMSGYTQETVQREQLVAPGAAFIEKPFTPRGLAARVREVLDARRSAGVVSAA